MFTYCTSNVLYSETTLHKTFHKYNIINIEFYNFLFFSTQYFILVIFHLFRMEFWHEHFNYIMDLHGILQIGVDLYNKLLGNTYVKSLPQLRYSDSIFTLTCTFLAVNEVKITLDPCPVHTLQHNTKIVSGLDIRRKWWKLLK